MTKATTTDDPLLRVREVAGRLSVGLRTAYELVESGELDCVRIGRVIRVPQTSVDAYLARHTTPANP